MNGSAPIFSKLPPELLHEIYQYLVLPGKQHISSPWPNAPPHSLQSFNTAPVAFLDTRIYLPVQAPANVLASCKYLRESFLDYVAWLAHSRIRKSDDHVPFKPDTVDNLVRYREPDIEEKIDKARDDGSVRISLEIERPLRGNMWAIIPRRNSPSPRIIALQPLFERLKTIKLLVWATWPWWNGPPLQRGQSNADWPRSRDPNSCVTEPDRLSVAIGKLMAHFPSIEEINIDVLMHATEYFNWDLPEIRYEGIRPWLSDSIMTAHGQRVKRVYRRLMVPEPGESPMHAATFFHRLEESDYSEQNDGRCRVSVKEGTGVVPEHWAEAQENPPFTTAYDFIE